MSRVNSPQRLMITLKGPGRPGGTPPPASAERRQPLRAEFEKLAVVLISGDAVSFFADAAVAALLGDVLAVVESLPEKINLAELMNHPGDFCTITFSKDVVLPPRPQVKEAVFKVCQRFYQIARSLGEGEAEAAEKAMEWAGLLLEREGKESELFSLSKEEKIKKALCVLMKGNLIEVNSREPDFESVIPAEYLNTSIQQVLRGEKTGDLDQLAQLLPIPVWAGLLRYRTELHPVFEHFAFPKLTALFKFLHGESYDSAAVPAFNALLRAGGEELDKPAVVRGLMAQARADFLGAWAKRGIADSSLEDSLLLALANGDSPAFLQKAAGGVMRAGGAEVFKQWSEVARRALSLLGKSALAAEVTDPDLASGIFQYMDCDFLRVYLRDTVEAPSFSADEVFGVLEKIGEDYYLPVLFGRDSLKDSPKLNALRRLVIEKMGRERFTAEYREHWNQRVRLAVLLKDGVVSAEDLRAVAAAVGLEKRAELFMGLDDAEAAKVFDESQAIGLANYLFTESLKGFKGQMLGDNLISKPLVRLAKLFPAVRRPLLLSFTAILEEPPFNLAKLIFAAQNIGALNLEGVNGAALRKAKLGLLRWFGITFSERKDELAASKLGREMGLSEDPVFTGVGFSMDNAFERRRLARHFYLALSAIGGVIQPYRQDRVELTSRTASAAEEKFWPKGFELPRLCRVVFQGVSYELNLANQNLRVERDEFVRDEPEFRLAPVGADPALLARIDERALALGNIRPSTLMADTYRRRVEELLSGAEANRSKFREAIHLIEINRSDPDLQAAMKGMEGRVEALLPRMEGMSENSAWPGYIKVAGLCGSAALIRKIYHSAHFPRFTRFGNPGELNGAEIALIRTAATCGAGDIVVEMVANSPNREKTVDEIGRGLNLLLGDGKSDDETRTAVAAVILALDLPDQQRLIAYAHYGLSCNAVTGDPSDSCEDWQKIIVAVESRHA